MDNPPSLRVQAYRLRLYPNQAQEWAMVQFRGGSVCVYNWALEQYEAGWSAYCEAVAALPEDMADDQRKAAKKAAFQAHWPNRFALSRDLTQMKKLAPAEGERDYRWLADVQAQTLSQALIDCERATQRFLQSVRNKDGESFPRFRSARRHESFRYQQGVKCDDRRVYLPKIGWVRYRAGRAPQGRITQATVKREAGAWYCAVFTERPMEVSPVPADPTTAEGVLLGIDAIVTTSAGLQRLNPQYLERDLDRLARAQRDLARKQKGSRNRRKAVLRVQRIHARIAACRQDTLHQLSRDLVDAHSAIFTQNADFRVEQAAPAPRARHRKMADAGRGALRQMLAYKAGWAGKGFVAVESPCEDSGDGQIPPRSRAEAVRAAGLAVLANGRTPVEGDGQ